MSRGSGPRTRVRLKVQRLPHAEGLALPAYQTPEAAGMDLIAAVPAHLPIKLKPRGRAQVPTGLRIELPAGTEAQVRPRSGLAWKHGVTVINAPGTIDSDYRGEVMVLLVNLGSEAFTIQRGERIAQLVVQNIARASLVEVEEVAPSRRGDGGFGSTGTASATPVAIKAPTARRRDAGVAKRQRIAITAQRRRPKRKR